MSPLPPAPRTLLVLRQACPNSDDPWGGTTEERAARLLGLLERAGIQPGDIEIVDASCVTGWGLSHPVLQEILRRVRAGRYDLIVARDPARFGRSPGPRAWPEVLNAAREGGASLFVHGQLVDVDSPLESLDELYAIAAALKTAPRRRRRRASP